MILILGHKLVHQESALNSSLSTVIISPTRNSYTLSELKCGTYYKLELQSYNTAGYSPNTSTINLKTQGGSKWLFDRNFKIFVIINYLIKKIRLWFLTTFGCKVMRFSNCITIIKL